MLARCAVGPPDHAHLLNTTMSVGAQCKAHDACVPVPDSAVTNGGGQMAAPPSTTSLTS